MHCATDDVVKLTPVTLFLGQHFVEVASPTDQNIFRVQLRAVDVTRTSLRCDTYQSKV